VDLKGGKKHRLSDSFPGTVVAMEIDTSDSRSYYLHPELFNTDIF
jgi:hypothetical protein